MSTQHEPPTEADVVVIGGGSLGASVLYHCAERGLKGVLLEKDELTSGTTWHSAGMLWRLRPADVDIELHTYTRDMCMRLEEETGVASWTENGGLFIAKNEERLSEYKRLAELGNYFGIESRVVSPADAKEIYPLLNVDDVHGALYSPTDGTIDPTGIVTAYARAARKRGGAVFEKNGAAAVHTEPGPQGTRRVTGVTTASGHHIKTSRVVNAAGAWAGKVAEMCGVKIPLLAMRHAFVLTEPIPGMHSGLPNVRDHDLSIYLKTQGDSIAAGGYEQNPAFWTPDDSFAFGLFDLCWDTFNQNLEGHLHRAPAIGDAGIKSTVCGPESFTPDHKPLVGPHPDVHGLYMCCGFNSMGMMQGGSMGRELATWMVEGSPSLDLFGVDCARFHDATVRDDALVLHRTHESYAKTYAIVFPHDEPLAGRENRKSALFEALLAQGCVYQSRHGFERPGWFVPTQGEALRVKPYDFYGAYDAGEGEVTGTDFVSPPAHAEHPYLDAIEGELTFEWGASHQRVCEEVEACRNGVAFFDQSYFGKFYLEGPDATAALDWMCTARLDGRAIGSVAYTALCNQRGGVEADLTVTKIAEDSWYIAAGGSTATHDWRWIRGELVNGGFEATLRDASDDYAMLSVQGPQSRAIIQSLITSDDSLADDHFAFSTSKQLEVAGHPVRCLRLTFVGELGFELHCPAACAVEVYQKLWAAATDAGRAAGFPVANAGYRAIDTMSAEKGYRHWHADLTNRDTPIEANIGFVAVAKLKNTETPFIGRDALQRQRSDGVRRKLVCLTVDKRDVPLHGTETIWKDGRCAGYVRSTAYGHSIGRSIAYGYVDADADTPKITNKWLQAGAYEIGDRGVRHAATLHLKPPFDPDNQRIKGVY